MTRVIHMPLVLVTAIPLLALAPIPAASAQTCRDDIPATAPDSRFTDNGDGTVSDFATGLIWKRCLEGQSGNACSGIPQRFTWQQALAHARDAVYAGSSLWRLPNKNELESLVERRCWGPAINLTYFPNQLSLPVWSSSSHAGDSSAAWLVSFDIGGVYGDGKGYGWGVRLVRGGQ